VYLGQKIKLKLLVERVFLISKRFFGVPSFFKYAIAEGIFNLLFLTRQLSVDYSLPVWMISSSSSSSDKTQETPDHFTGIT